MANHWQVTTKLDKIEMQHIHITRSLYNKSYQTDLLLKHHYTLDNGNIVNVCEEIKYMTLELDYIWQWDNYC